MRKIFQKENHSGTVLILVLWSLTLLTVFAVHIGLRVRGKVDLLSRLDKRDRSAAIAESCIAKAISILNTKFKIEGKLISDAAFKKVRFNNPEAFQEIKIDQGTCSINYRNYGVGSEKKFGITDEERKININTASHDVLKSIIQIATPLKEEMASNLALAIIDWREYGSSQVEGFYSDAFYENLEFPYKEKKRSFEILDELLLVRGVNQKLYDQLRDFITIYGTGKVNINTASKPVLLALGLSAGAVNKMLIARRGPDRVDATEDDYIFEHFSSLEALIGLVNLTRKELRELDLVYGRQEMGMLSAYYGIQADVDYRGETRHVECVYSRNDGKIIYWREKL